MRIRRLVLSSTSSSSSCLLLIFCLLSLFVVRFVIRLYNDLELLFLRLLVLLAVLLATSSTFALVLRLEGFSLQLVDHWLMLRPAGS